MQRSFLKRFRVGEVVAPAIIDSNTQVKKFYTLCITPNKLPDSWVSDLYNLYKGDHAIILESIEHAFSINNPNDQKIWYRIITSKGVIGYMEGSYLEEITDE